VPDRIEKPLSLRYSDDNGELAELIGISPALPHARPGEVIRVNLYWRALRTGSSKLQSYLHSTDSAVVRRDSLPATGNLLASDWQAGQMWTESYLVRIPGDAEVQLVDNLVAGLYDPQRQAPLTAKDQSGKAVTPLVGRIAINGPSQRSDNYAFRLGNEIGLDTPSVAQTGDQIEVCLRWYALVAVSNDYTIFVHATEGSSPPLAQADVQPRGGRYPTSFWLPGETIAECIKLNLKDAPPTFQIAVGMYDPRTTNRLALTDSKGNRLPNDQIVLPGGTR